MSACNEDDYYGIVGKNSVRRTFTIPVGNMTPEEAKKELEKLMTDYKEPIDIMSDPYSTYTHPVMVCGATGPIGIDSDPYSPRVLGLKEPTNLPGHRNPPPPPTHSVGTNPTIISKISVEKKKSWFRKLFS